MTSSKQVWSTVFWVGLMVLITAFVMYSSRRIVKKNDVIITNGEDAIAIVQDASGKFLELSCLINGRTFIFTDGEPFSFIEEGEKFRVKYLPESPSDIVVLYDDPIFPEEIEHSLTSVLKIQETGSMLQFEYEVNGNTWKRRKFNQGENLNDLSLYAIKYRVENPKIGYLIRKE